MSALRENELPNESFLAEPDDDSSDYWARGINDYGVVVGPASPPGLDEVNALPWQDAASDPGILEFPDESVVGDARGISEDDTIVGFYVAENGEPNYHGALWHRQLTPTALNSHCGFHWATS